MINISMVNSALEMALASLLMTSEKIFRPSK